MFLSGCAPWGRPAELSGLKSFPRALSRAREQCAQAGGPSACSLAGTSGGSKHMNRARHIGIVAVSAEGAALCYRTLCSESAAVLGPHDHPQVTMHTYPLTAYMQHVYADRWYEAGRLLLSSANILVRAAPSF